MLVDHHGLVPKELSLGLVPEYELDTAELHTRVSKQLIKRAGNVDLLTFSDCGFRAYSKLYNVLPTWAPNWKMGTVTDNSSITDRWKEWRPTLAPEGPLCADFDDSTRALLVRGAIVDTIDVLVAHNSDNIEYAVNAEWARPSSKSMKAIHGLIIDMASEGRRRQWQLIATCHRTMYESTGENILDAYARTIVFDARLSKDVTATTSQEDRRIAGRHDECDEVEWERPSAYFLASSEYRRHLYSHQTVEVVPSESFDPSKVQYAESLKRHDASWGKRLIVSKHKSSLGICRAMVKSEDKLVLLRGARMPCVLRQVKYPGRESDSWKFLGDAYVHGLMCYEEDPQGPLEDIDLKNIQPFRIV